MFNFINRSLLVAMLLCCGTALFAQKNTGSYKLFFERAWLHTDRGVYGPGDDIWIKAYLLNAQDNHLIPTSSNLYIELLSPADTLQARLTLQLNNGIGKGDIHLADNAQAGTYHLRAYTNWMRNFGDNFVFDKTIVVLGKSAGAPANATNSTAVAPQLASTSTGGVTAGLVVRFFPEGGSLVQQLSSIVAVKAESATGKGLAVQGAILSVPGADTVARFNCDSTGMGRFALLPAKGQRYKAVYKYQGKEQSVQLPAALASGPVLRVSRTDSALLAAVSWNVGDDAAGSAQNLLIAVKHAGRTYFQQEMGFITSGRNLVSVPLAALPAGVSAITLYDQQRRPCAERLVFIESKSQRANISLKTDKPFYSARQKTTLSMQAKDAAGKPLKANLSVAVVDASLVPDEESGIDTYLLLQSEIRGNIDHIRRYFDTTNTDRAKQLDLLLMTQGWSEYLWRRLADSKLNIAYVPEQGFGVQGVVTNESKSKPLPGMNVSLFAYNATGIKLMRAITDSTGHFYFSNLNQTGSGQVVLTARDGLGKDAGRISVDSANKTGPAVTGHANLALPAGNAAQYALLGDRIQNKLKLTDTIKLNEVKVRARRDVALRDMIATSMGYPDEVLTVGANEDPKQTIHDYILHASKSAKLENGAQSPDRMNRIVFYAEGSTYDPRLIVDGYEVPVEAFGSQDESVKNDLYNRYFDLPITDAVKVVIKRMLAPPTLSNTYQPKHGFTNLSGSVSQTITTQPSLPVFIVYLTLKPGALDKQRGNVASINLNGYYQAREFYAPVYDGHNLHSPKADLRSTIHWQPLVETDANGQATLNYFNADSTPKVRIVVQGISETGAPVYGSLSYSVK